MGPKLPALVLSLATLLAPAGVARAADKAACLRAYESAQHDKNAGKLRAARSKLRVCVEPECPALLRADCATWLGEVERGMPSVVVVAREGGRVLTDVRVSVDDEPLAESLTGAALEVDPGSRDFRLEAPGHAPVERTISLRQGEKNRELVFDLAPPAARRETRARVPVASWVLGGIGAVGLVGFGYFGLAGLSGRGDLEDCKGECSQSDVDAVRADFVRADVSLAISALAFGGAAYFYFTAPRSELAPGAARRLRLGLAPRAGGAATALELTF